MKRSGSILLLVLIILTPLLLMSACLWRSTAYSLELVYACHTAEQRRALTKAGLLLVLKKINAHHQLKNLSFKGWPCSSSVYDLALEIIDNKEAYQAIAHLSYQNNRVCTLGAYYMPDASHTYKIYYAPSV